jgi:hypothetical protein
MRIIFFILLPVIAVLFCGCGKQEKINSQKIDALSQRMIQLEQIQTKQAAALQSQMTALAPELDKLSSSYFEKNQDAALFYHTNTLFLLLTVAKQIELQLQAADAARQTQDALVYSYHTNELDTMYLYAAHMESSLTSSLNSQESRLEDNLNAQTKSANTALSNALVNVINDTAAKQISALKPDAAEIARRQQLEANVAQLQHSLDLIKAQLDKTVQSNAPALRY